MDVKRGEIFLVKLDPVVGSEQGKTRPAVVIQNDIGNKYSQVTIIAPITSRIPEKEYPTDVNILPQESGLPEQSTILTNQIRSIDKTRIVKKLGKLDDFVMRKINLALKESLALD